jgi:hypothetical protein
MRIRNSVLGGLVLLASVPGWSQEQQRTPPVPAATGPIAGLSMSSDSDNDLDRMLIPPPVSGEVYPLWFSYEEEVNYVRGGVIFDTAYSDNVLAGTSATPVSDVSYSVWPTIELDETTSRLHTLLSYAPGFTFYQHTSAYNQADQNLLLDGRYRLSPHVTASLRDSFQKSSNVFNQPDEGLAGAVSGSAEGVNNSIIAPLADRLSNNGNAGITYQFSANAMIGASGTFTNLHYPDPAQVPGLYDAALRAGSAFYSYRLSRRHYVGAMYQYQELLSYPPGRVNQTQTHGAFLFYTFYPNPAFSLSLFAGPQYRIASPQSTGATPPLVPASQAWTPAGGISMNWQGRHRSMAVSYSHSINSGGGLIGAVELDQAIAIVRQQITRNLSASLAGAYANNGVLAISALGGHSISLSAALERQMGGHLSVRAGYTRLHQDYIFFSENPDTNREWVGISYQFARRLGR